MVLACIFAATRVVNSSLMEQLIQCSDRPVLLCSLQTHRYATQSSPCSAFDCCHQSTCRSTVVPYYRTVLLLSAEMHVPESFSKCAFTGIFLGGLESMLL